MTAVFAPSGNFVACGGMDNMLTLYDINNRDTTGGAKLVNEFAGYEGFLSSCRFLDDESLVTGTYTNAPSDVRNSTFLYLGSGDMKIMHWDLVNKVKIKSFEGHNGDIAALSMKPQDKQVFMTGSVDRTIRLWDLRTDKCQQTFWGHEADVNSLKFHPSGNTFVTCSEDKTARLWDIRSDQELAIYKPPTPNSSFTSTGVSVSGRLLFCSSDDSSIHMWDLIGGEHLGNMCGHENRYSVHVIIGIAFSHNFFHMNRITQITVAPSGIGLASSSWDFSVRCWGI